MDNARTAYVGCARCRNRNVVVTRRENGRMDKLYYDFTITMREFFDSPNLSCPVCGERKRVLDENGNEIRSNGLRLLAVE